MSEVDDGSLVNGMPPSITPARFRPLQSAGLVLLGVVPSVWICCCAVSLARLTRDFLVMPMFKGFRFMETVWDLANSTAIRLLSFMH
jgi:hypothetical protein